MRRLSPLLVIMLVLLLAGAGPPPAKNWPCVQRLVPSLAAATLWPGPAPAAGWHADPALTALAAKLTDRLLPTDDALVELRGYVADHPSAEQRAGLFYALVDAANAERGAAIERLRGIDRRLQSLADAAEQAATDLSALPADAPDSARDELANRRKLVVREYDSINRTVRYGCEIPGLYEAKLGRFAQILQPAPP